MFASLFMKPDHVLALTPFLIGAIALAWYTYVCYRTKAPTALIALGVLATLYPVAKFSQVFFLLPDWWRWHVNDFAAPFLPGFLVLTAFGLSRTVVRWAMTLTVLLTGCYIYHELSTLLIRMPTNGFVGKGDPTDALVEMIGLSIALFLIVFAWENHRNPFYTATRMTHLSRGASKPDATHPAPVTKPSGRVRLYHTGHQFDVDLAPATETKSRRSRTRTGSGASASRKRRPHGRQ